ncbi:hypothetical protein WN48_09000 [Eufriesea mexicana]|uniref:Uncharacterized protein n=1 Tax=Eufriesea mexicana TaxID=516756 RepID=A0A310SNJ6_9HYME|nr:hypothetical protein WN48_09000 [Eufriesea mexicana]
MTQRFSTASIIFEKVEMIHWCEQCDLEDELSAKDTKAFKKRISTALSQRIGNAKD